MDDTTCRRFFLEPCGAFQRQYEALRAVFIEGGRQKDVADRFGYDYGALRQLVRQFRADCASGQRPPFSAPRDPAGRRAPRRHRPSPSGRPPPIAAPSA
jgi:hypothetical protein